MAKIETNKYLILSAALFKDIIDIIPDSYIKLSYTKDMKVIHNLILTTQRQKSITFVSVEMLEKICCIFLEDKDDLMSEIIFSIIEGMKTTICDLKKYNLFNQEYLQQRVTDIVCAVLLEDTLNRFKNGADFGLIDELSTIIKEVQPKDKTIENITFPGIKTLLLQKTTDKGLKFRQPSLNYTISNISPPITIAIGSAVDKGKTSFLCDMLSYFAPQAHVLYPNRPMLWLTNEGKSDEIYPRLTQSALNKTSNEFISSNETDETIQKSYHEYTGNKEIIKIINAHGYHLNDVWKLVDTHNPCLVIFDMLANFKSTYKKDKRQDMLECLFQEVREYAALKSFIAISTVQLSADGYNMQYPPGTALKDVKIGMQGALDIQIMIGSLHDPQYFNTRWLSVVKNKRKVPGRPAYTRFEVHFNQDTVRFTELKTEKNYE